MAGGSSNGNFNVTMKLTVNVRLLQWMVVVQPLPQIPQKRLAMQSLMAPTSILATM